MISCVESRCRVTRAILKGIACHDTDWACAVVARWMEWHDRRWEFDYFFPTLNPDKL